MSVRSILVSLSLPLILAGCGTGNVPTGSQINERVTSTPSSAQISEAIRGRAVVVNLTSNVAEYYENGSVVKSWRVITGNTSRGWDTPQGLFYVHTHDKCPPWNGSSGSAAPCAANNPLGKYALWFHQGYLYGLHGTNAPELFAQSNRRLSHGCIRNPNDVIEWLYNRTLNKRVAVIVKYF